MDFIFNSDEKPLGYFKQDDIENILYFILNNFSVE